MSLSEEAKGSTFVTRKMETVEKVEEISRSVNILKAIDLGYILAMVLFLPQCQLYPEFEVSFFSLGAWKP